MPLTFGVVFGILSLIVGTVFYRVARLKRTGIVLIGLGTFITLMIVLLMLAAAMSPM